MKLSLFCLLACLAGQSYARGFAFPEEPSRSPEPNAKAEARLTRDDCKCQCINLTWRNNQTRQVYGNCGTEYRGAVWCYVADGRYSTCIDRKQSTRRETPDRYWSYHACTTPPEKECLDMIGKDKDDRDKNDDDDDDDRDNDNDGYDPFDVDDEEDYDIDDVYVYYYSYGDEYDNDNDNDDDDDNDSGVTFNKNAGGSNGELPTVDVTQFGRVTPSVGTRKESGGGGDSDDRVIFGEIHEADEGEADEDGEEDFGVDKDEKPKRRKKIKVRRRKQGERIQAQQQQQQQEGDDGP